jgi:ABC-type transport system involved in multi-copper enzyme maturation permease subunit
MLTPEQTQDLINKLISLMNTAGNSLWKMAEKQYYTNLYGEIFWIILSGVLLTLLIILLVKAIKTHDNRAPYGIEPGADHEPLFFAYGVLSMVFLVTIALVGADLYQQLMNPEYQKLLILVNLVKNLH